MQRRALHDEARVALHLPEHVANRVRLARSRRAVQQYTALEMLPRSEQLLTVLGDSDGVLLDALQRDLGQDETLPRHRRGVEELERDATRHRRAHLQQTPAVHVESITKTVEFVEDGLRLRDGQARDLDAQFAAHVIAAAQIHGVGAARIAHEEEDTLVARQRAAVTVGQIRHRRSDETGRCAVAGHEAHEIGAAVVARHVHAAHVDGAPRAHRPGVDRDL